MIEQLINQLNQIKNETTTDKASDAIDNKLLNELLTNLDHGKTIINEMKPLNFTEDEMNYLYNMAVKQFEIGNYAKALPFFQLLMVADNTNPLYSKALAGCFQANKDYINASFCYQLTYLLHPESQIDCLFYNGVCMFESGDYVTATKFFNDYMASNATEEKLVNKSQMYLKAITNLEIPVSE